MRTLLKSLLYLFAGMVVLSSCKKTETAGLGSFNADDYTFNRATKSFSTNKDVSAQITSSDGIRYVYAYLIRTNATDSLIAVASPNNATDYTFTIPTTSFPLNNMSKATGVKVLAKQADNSTVEGFIKITYFDPALPQLKDFPIKLTADLNGGNTAITGNITSDYGLAQVDIYDDYQTENTYVLVNSITSLSNAKQYALNYAYKYRKAAQHIKVVAKDIYGQSNELIIAMPVDVTLFKPKFVSFPATITPNVGSPTAFTGTITSVTGLKRIDVYDDYQGAYALVSSLSNLNSSLNYSFNYSYTYRKRAANLKVVAVDLEDVQSELVIPLNINYGTTLYRDVVMNAQTTGTNTIFFAETGTTAGNCNLNASEATMAFLFYGTSTGPAFYSPTNTASVASNFKCNGTSWSIANTGALRATRFRVLVPGTTGIDNIYAQYNANNIDVIDDAFFTANGIAVPGSSSSRFDATAAATTAIFNTTSAYLIYVRIPDVSGTGYKNALLRAKEATSTTGTSTIKFDIYIQK
ncbi:hypothetical protein [Pedobacter nototheniae]|uniref:hypothetical protein n=1 Tax=Pedobacter nototheniae TaxID=2488994 RepID=UPI00293004AE|nr:hypothetical protein [Pedobacter nototheniae]